MDVTNTNPQAEAFSTVVRWGIAGALVGGAVGALVAGGTAAAISGVRSLQERRQRRGGEHDGGGDSAPNNNLGRRPLFTYTSTSYSSTPWGSTLSVTSNASGQLRSTTFRDTPGPSSTRGPGWHRRGRVDQQILQMLRSHVVNQGAATAEMADQMTLDELLHQFRFPGGHVHDQPRGGNRGASTELIDRCSVVRMLDTEDSVRELRDNQTTCNVCLETFARGDSVREMTHCSHIFHKECIDQWLSRVASCPICKHELEY